MPWEQVELHGDVSHILVDEKTQNREMKRSMTRRYRPLVELAWGTLIFSDNPKDTVAWYHRVSHP